MQTQVYYVPVVDYSYLSYIIDDKEEVEALKDRRAIYASFRNGLYFSVYR